MASPQLPAASPAEIVPGTSWASWLENNNRPARDIKLNIPTPTCRSSSAPQHPSPYTLSYRGSRAQKPVPAMTGRQNGRGRGNRGRPQPFTPPRTSPNTSSPSGSSPSSGSLIRRRETLPLLHSGDGWKKQPEVKIRMSQLNSNEVRRVYDALKEFGNILSIDAGRDSPGWCAYVVFRPPPAIALWERYENIQKLEMRQFWVSSPINPGIKYPEHTFLSPETVEFGAMLDETTMKKMATAVPLTSRIQLVLNLKRKELDIYFPLMVPGSHQAQERKFRFRLPISQLQRIFEVPRDSSGQRALVIPFNTPPEFYRQTPRIFETFIPSDRKWSEWLTWYRQTTVASTPVMRKMANRALRSHTDDVMIDIGHWTTYRFTFDETKLSGDVYYGFRRALIDHNVQFIPVDRINIVTGPEPALNELLHEETSVSNDNHQVSRSYFDQLSADKIALSFAVRYQLEVCLSNGWLNENRIEEKFLRKLAAMKQEEARYILEKVAERQIRYVDPMEVFNIPIKGNISRKVPSYCVLTRSATITPTMIHVATPLVETSNRIMRAYKDYEDRFLRVRFTDEKTIGRINSQDNNRSEEVFQRIRTAMREGIVVAGRHYQFLAFGNSQFREHGAYFFSPTYGHTLTGSNNIFSAEDIRQGMGDFGHIKTVAKFGARIGQCFSTTRAINSTKVEIIEIPDIERNGYAFTDGVGKISTFLAQMSAQELGLQNPFDDYPSLFQFRLGGCKGVLALDPSLKRQEVHIRPSQYKFPAPQKGLEVIRSSAFATACFNRQLVIVLSTLGVPDHVFLQKQQEMVNDLEIATKDENVALAKLQRNIDFNQTTLTMAKMILDGFMGTNEPFMMSLLHLWRAFNIKFLKEKARIVIEKGAFVLGCVDETATLRGHFNKLQSNPDATRGEKLASLPEIFLQISDPEKRGYYKIIEGICILARNPSLHAGDLRIVQAVNCPALHHLKNVVVLPQTGDRDLANMCSGGDLDGDDYLVMWDDDFLPPEINAEPMDFTPEKPQELDRPVTVEDMIDFFITYMKNDSLARIALAHLCQADFNEEGVRDEKCLRLAALHSQAVDYPKSGIPAVMNKDLRPMKWPHFMENRYRTPDKIYKSKKVLGQMYDQIKLVDFEPQYELDFDKRILNAYKLDENILQQAKNLKESYDSAIRRLMAKHAINTEFEVWTTFALAHNQESRDYSFAEELGRTVAAISDQFRELCRTAAGVKVPTDFTKMAPFVAAMYTVTANEMKQALEECKTMKTVGGRSVPVRKKIPEDMPLMSFPWLFVNEMGKIAAGGPAENEPAIAQQGVAKKIKKHFDTTTQIAPGVGDVKTKKGVLHIGDILKLFDDAKPSSPQPLLDGVIPLTPNEMPKKPEISIFDEYLTQAEVKFDHSQVKRKENELEESNNESVPTPTEDEGEKEGEREEEEEEEGDDNPQEVLLDVDDRPTAIQLLAGLLGE